MHEAPSRGFSAFYNYDSISTRLRFNRRSTAYQRSLRSQWRNPLAEVTLTYLVTEAAVRQLGCNVGRRMVVARSNCNRMGVEPLPNRSRIVVVITADLVKLVAFYFAGERACGRHGCGWRCGFPGRHWYLGVSLCIHGIVAAVACAPHPSPFWLSISRMCPVDRPLRHSLPAIQRKAFGRNIVSSVLCKIH